MFSSRPVPTNRHNPCPICEDTKSNCRILADETIFCHGFADAVKGEKINGYVCVKPANGHTATFRPDNSQEWANQQRTARRIRRAPKQKDLLRNLLTISERNKEYRKITTRLQLNQNHTTNLKDKRGLSDLEIDFAYQMGWIRSWNPGLRVNIDNQVAGVNPNTHRLVGVPGIAIAALTPEGRIAATDGNDHITGFQLAPDDRDKFSKYFWLSSAKHGGNSPHLPNGELPLFIWKHPEAKEINEVWLVEGALKPLITALKLWFRDNHRTDIMVIGAAGGNFAGSAKTLKDALANTNCKRVKLQPDAGAVSNSHITENYRKIINSLINDGYECTIGWWGQSTSSFPDIDELESFSNITYLSTFEYKSLCIKWGGIKDNPAYNIIDLDYQEKVAVEQKKLHSLTYPADYVCDSSQKYLPDLVGKIPTSGIVSLKSPKGSGKSTQIKKIKDYCCGYTEEIEIKPEVEPEQLSLFGKNQKETTEIEIKVEREQLSLIGKTNFKSKQPPRPEIKTIRHKGLGMNFISINARIALGRAQAVQWDFTWIEDVDLESKEEFGTKVSTHSAIENISEIGCCWDSLGKLFERDWSNTLVVIDEIELGLNHLSTSSTCKDRRSFILKTLEVKLKECLDNGGLVLVADADFTDISYDYLKAITGHTPYIVQHNYLGDPWDIEFYTGKRDLFLTTIEDWVSDKNCEPIAIALDNQKECEALANHLIKKFPYLKNHIGGLIRIDSKITQTDFGKDFVKHTVKRIEKYKPKILMYTPSLGVGCDIHIKYFKHVFGLFYGNLEPSQARQMLARVRQSVPRSVWCKASSNNSTDTPTSYLPSEIKKRLFSNQKSTTEIIELALQLAKENAQATDIDDIKLLPLLIEQLQSMMGDGGWDNPHVDLYCKQIARRNYSLNQLAVQLRQELIDEGHILTDVAIDEATVTGDSVRFEKDEIKRQKAELTATSSDIEVEEAMRIKNKPARTEEENHKATKALLKRELPGVTLTPDFLYKAIYKDDRRWLNQVKLFWMALNPEITKELDSIEWRKKLKQFSSGVNYIPDIKTYSHKVEVIEKTGLLDFLDPLEEFTEDSPKIQQFVKDCHRYRKKLKSAFGIHLTKDYPPIKLLNRLLSRIGLKMVVCRIVQQYKVKVRYYKLNENDFYDTNRLAVISSLNQKFKNELPYSAQNQSQQPEQRRQKLDKYLYNNETSVSNKKPESDVIQDVGYTPSSEVIQDVGYSPSSTTQENAELLSGIGDWGDMTLSQEQINEAIVLLSETEQARLHKLFEDYQQQNHHFHPFKNDSPQTTQSQSQQAEQWRQKLDKYLYNNETSVSNKKPESEILQDVAYTPSEARINNEIGADLEPNDGNSTPIQTISADLEPNDGDSTPIQTIGADLEPNDGDSTPIRTSLQMLREAIVGGVEAVKTTICRWTCDRRWCAVLLLEEVAEGELRNLEQMIPSFYAWLGES